MFQPQSKINKKAVLSFLAVIVIAVGIFGLVHPAAAAGGPMEWICSLLNAVLYYIHKLLAYLLALIISILVAFASYNNFIYEGAVIQGWVMVRDVCNMFFIVMLLYIAFCTVLRIEKYSYSQLLGKLLLAAIIINFSKMICGLLIDVSQVVTLTFVNAFKDVAAGNLTEGMGLTKMTSDATGDGMVNAGPSESDKLVANVLGAVMLVITLIVTVCITVIFAMRIVTLWFLVIFSPMAFLFKLVPVGQGMGKFGSEWWSKMTNNLIVGPVLAFCLWLSFAIVNKTGASQIKPANKVEIGTPVTGVTDQGTQISFIIGIGLLIMSMTFAKQMGVAGGEMMAKAQGKISATAKGALIGGVKMGLRESAKAPGRLFRGAKGAGRLGSELAKEEGRERMKTRFREVPEKALRGAKELWTKKAKEPLMAKEAKKAGEMRTEDLQFRANDGLASQEKRVVAQRELQKRGKMDERSAKQAAEDMKNMPHQYEEFKGGMLSNDPNMARKVFYDGLATKEGVDKFKADVKAKKVDAGKVLEGMKKHELNAMTDKEKTGMAADDLGQFAINSLGKDSLKSFAGQSERFGLNAFDNVNKSMFNNDKGEYDEDKAMKYAEATGRLDQINQNSEDYDRFAIGQLQQGNVSRGAFKNEKICELIDKNLSSKQKKNLFEKDKEAENNYVATQKKRLAGAGGYKSDEGKKIIENTCAAGGKLDVILDFNSPEPDKKLKSLEALDNGMKASVGKGQIKIEDVARSDAKKMAREAVDVIAKNMPSKEDFKKFFKENWELAARVAASGNMSEKILNDSKLMQNPTFEKMVKDEIMKNMEIKNAEIAGMKMSGDEVAAGEHEAREQAAKEKEEKS